MTIKITRTNVTIHNAKFISDAMCQIAGDWKPSGPKIKGLTRAMRRVFDWICWGTYIKFVVKLDEYRGMSPTDGEWHEYGAVEYNQYRAKARNRTCGPDEIADDEKFRLINDHQFQLRLIDWAQGVMRTWTNRITIKDGFPEEICGLGLQLKYVTGVDNDDAVFYVPEFELAIPRDWETRYSVKLKHKLAEAIEFLSLELQRMYDNMVWLDESEIKVAQRVLDYISGADEEECRYIDSYVNDHDPAAVGDDDKLPLHLHGDRGAGDTSFALPA